MSSSVEISFDCLPLRSVGRLDVPLDASEDFRALVERVKCAIGEHGSHNTYYLHRASCIFRLTNDIDVGMLQFDFEGIVLTDPADQQTVSCTLQVQLAGETCDWLTEPVVIWFQETVSRAVQIEFDRYITSGDLELAKRRVEQINATSDGVGGYLGMYL